MSVFKKAERKKAKLRLAISGPSGSGKTMGALTIAKGIGGRIALIDTERSSASLYADPVKLGDGTLWQPPAFDAVDIEPPFAPEKFVEMIVAAGKEGYDILIIDSMTHEWNGSGGVLELVDQVARAKFGGNSYMAWSEMTPRHRKFVDAILNSPMHVIVTLRSKTETEQVTDERGKKKVVKLGMKAETRDNTDYEFTTVLELVHDGHFATSGKDRTGLFSGDPKPLSEATGKALLKWLNTGSDVKPEPKAEPPKPAEPSETYMKAKGAILGAKDAAAVDKLAATIEQRISQKAVTDEQGIELLQLCETRKAELSA